MQKKKGISLIVLVITIIVMIILAAAIIISLNNTGIIGNANKAVSETNKKTVEEIANLAWGEAYASGVRDEAGLKSAVEKALKANNINAEDYGIYVTEKGVTIGWIKTKDNKIIKGNKVLEIGDVVNYHDTANADKTDKYTGTWQVLGVEDGKIKLISTTNVGDKLSIDVNPDRKSDAMQYTTIVNKLNEECVPYGKGKGAEYARSVKIEDIDSVTGYDKTTYNKGKINEYGNTVTYYWDNTSGKESYPYYESTNGVSGNLTREHAYFSYFLNNNIETSKKPNSINSKQKITSITSTYYSYKLNDKNLLEGAANEKAFNLLSWDENTYDDGYFLASTYVETYTSMAWWGVQYIYADSMNYDDEYSIGHSYANFSSTSGGFTIYSGYIRAVVILDSNVTLTGSSISGWNIN